MTGRDADIFSKIQSVIAKQLGVDAAKITLESKIGEDLGADSLDATELVMALEEEFNIEILDTDAEKMIAVKDVLAYLDKVLP